MLRLNYAMYADVFGADLLPRFLGLREGEQQLILAVVCRDRYVAGEPVVPSKYLRRKDMTDDERAQTVVAAGTFYDGRSGTFLHNAEFLSVLAATKQRLHRLMASPMMDEIEVAIRAERKRRLAAEEAVDTQLAIMRNVQSPERDRRAVAEWIFAGRAEMPVEVDEQTEGDHYADEWDAATAVVE